MVTIRSLLQDGLGESSLFYRSHPLLNFLWFVCVIGVTMFSNHPAFLLLSFLLAWVYSVLLKGWKALKLNALILLPVLVIMTLVNCLTSHNGVTVLFYINGNRITQEAIVFGLVSAVMLSAVIIWFSCFSVIVTADKFIYLFGRAAPALALTLSMIMRYIPLLRNRFREVAAGQRCMGRGGKGRGPVNRVRQLGKELSILIAWSLEASIESADSMEARGYGLHRRSSFHLFRLDGRDKLLLLLMLLLGGIVVTACALGQTSIYYYPAIRLPGLTLLQAISLPAYGLLIALPIALDLREARKWN